MPRRKRKLPGEFLTESEDSSIRRPKLIVLPGSSGSLSKNIADSLIPRLQQTYDVVIRTGRWKGWKTTSADNASSVLDLCPESRNKGAPYFILGNSFGNRVLCSLFVENAFEQSRKQLPAGIILCGYPLYSAKYENERVALLEAMPSGLPICCLSGSNDEFLHRSPPCGKKTGEILKGRVLFESVLDSMNTTVAPELHIIERGGHGVLDVAASKLEEAAEEVLRIIVDFTERLR